MTPPPHLHRPACRPRAWTARYDRAALRPPGLLPAGQAQALQQHPAWPALRRWCLHGSGPGTRPGWQPKALPVVAERFTVAHLQGDDTATLGALAAALCLERDGSLQLQACRSAGGRVGLRLKTKLHDVMGWRARQPGDAWDSGYVIHTPAGLQALARFSPRRATLLVAEDLPAPVLQALVVALLARQAVLTQPVRLLVVSGGALPAGLTGLAVTSLPLAAPAR